MASHDNEVLIKRGRKTLPLLPIDHVNRAAFLSGLATLLFERFEQFEEIEDLEEAITYYQEALALRPAGHPDHAESANDLADAIHTRFEQLGRIEDLEDAIAYNREILTLTPQGHPDRSTSLNNLASAISTRFEQLGKIEDLEEVITYRREALILQPHGDPGRSASLNDLANDIFTRFEQLRRMEDLEEAIAYLREALTLRPKGHPYHSSSLNNLAVALSTCFEQLGRIEDLEEATTHHREALTLRPKGHPDRDASLDNLANSLYTRFGQLGRTEDLEDAIAYSREALTLRPVGHPERTSSLDNLANALHTRFTQLGMIEDLENAIADHCEALTLRPKGHPYHSSSLNNLAVALSTRFEQLGRIEDLEEATTHHHEALTLRPKGHPDRNTSLHNLANDIYTRFEQLGRTEDLEDTIAYNREALTLRPEGHPARSSSYDNLANALYTRFTQLGMIEDLEDAIAGHREALTLRPKGHPSRSISLNNLAMTIFTRFRQLEKIEDLEEVITHHREALTLHPQGHPKHCVSLNNLANAFSTRFETLGKIEDLDEAIEYCCQTLILHPRDRPDWSLFVFNFCAILFSRFQELGTVEDLKRATAQLSEITNNVSHHHPMQARIRSHLALYTLVPYTLSPNLGDRLRRRTISAAFTLFEDAANQPTSSIMHRFEAAVLWGQEAKRLQHHSAMHAYTKSLALLDRCLIAIPTVELQQKFLASKRVPKHIASDAASIAIDMGHLEAAAELLEQGRAILWSKMRGYRQTIEEIRQVDRHLADRFETLSFQLENLAILSEKSSTDSDAVGPKRTTLFDTKVRRHRLLSEEWDSVVERIRQIDRFKYFLQSVPFSILQSAAREGPVVIVNISQYRSDAIIICATGTPALVPLPEASPETITRLYSQLTEALANSDSAKRRVVRGILRTLWDIVVLPVREQLAASGVVEKSRIWWCPTSDLCALPLHAAGPYEEGQKNLPDIYISSYTPTLSSLIRARISASLDSKPAVPKLLVMGQPGDGLEIGKLAGVKEEIRRIHSFGNFVDVLVAGDANRQSVLSQLQQHNWIHFACHGCLEIRPFESYFKLHGNERLTLTDLMTARLPNAELAFLSACHTAALGVGGTPDEVIHLAAAVQFCGFRSVVGTLWAMADIDGPDIAEDFYRHMFRGSGGAADFRESAMALNLATQALKNKKGITIDRWINYVHFGA